MKVDVYINGEGPVVVDAHQPTVRVNLMCWSEKSDWDNRQSIISIQWENLSVKAEVENPFGKANKALVEMALEAALTVLLDRRLA